MENKPTRFEKFIEKLIMVAGAFTAIVILYFLAYCLTSILFKMGTPTISEAPEYVYVESDETTYYPQKQMTITCYYGDGEANIAHDEEARTVTLECNEK